MGSCIEAGQPETPTGGSFLVSRQLLLFGDKSDTQQAVHRQALCHV